MRNCINQRFVEFAMKTSTLSLLIFMIFISGTSLSYSETIQKTIDSEAAARQLAIKAQGTYMEGSSHPPLADSAFALPIIDEDSGNVLGHIIANKIRLISVLNDAGLTEISSAIAAAPKGKRSSPGTTGGIFTAVEINVQSGIKYDWWDDDRDNNASQLSIPVKIDASYDKYSATLLAGFANTSVELSDGTSESLSNILDTKLNLSYEMIGTWPVHILVGLDFNFPTGKTDFTQEELVLIMDPDLISINTFGEGFNINPTVTAVKKWEALEAGVGVGYVWRGEYSFSEDLSNYDPGNIVNALAEMRYYFLPEWSARVFGYYAHYGKDKEDGTDFAQEGDHYLFGMGIKNDHIKWVAGATVRAVFRDKSKFQETTGGLFTEDNNSQGSEWVGDIFFTYNLDDNTTLQSSFQGLYIGENDYSSDSPRFIGSRKKMSLGAGVTREFDRKIKGELNMKGFIIDDAKTNFPKPLESTNYKGLSVMVMVNRGF